MEEKAGLTSTLAALIVSNIYLIGKILDMATTITYRNAAFDDESQSVELLERIVVKGAADYSQKDFLFLLRQEFPDGFIVEKGNLIAIDPLTFKFSDDRLERVCSINSSEDCN